MVFAIFLIWLFLTAKFHPLDYQVVVIWRLKTAKLKIRQNAHKGDDPNCATY